MKAVLLAGGFGTRISEETQSLPKPMIAIGGKPILWHIMKIYSHYGINDFIICLGYRGYVIKEYFLNYASHQSDLTIDFKQGGAIEVHQNRVEPWKVSLIDTGEDAMTGGRLLQLKDFLDDDFCFTYGDGVADIDISKLVAYHRAHGKLATVTSVSPPGRYGALVYGDNNAITKFAEKPTGDGGRINGGFFVLSPRVIDYIPSRDTPWEREPLMRLAEEGQLVAYNHDGFWHAMDTLRDKNYLESCYQKGAEWKVWR